MTDPTPDTPAVPEPVAWDKLRLWFFRELSDSQRIALLKLYGMPVDEPMSLGFQQIAFKSVFPPLFSEDKMRAALDRAERAERILEAHKVASQSVADMDHARITTAEAALAEARKVIEAAKDGLADGVNNYPARFDLYGNLIPEDEQSPWVKKMHVALDTIRQWLSANPAKETT